MAWSLVQDALAVGSGSLVGFSLGLVGGGGSILAVPLMIYVVGVKDTHLAIGTSALAVSLNAAVNLWHHARCHSVKWRCAGLFAATGVIGAFAGSSISKIVDGQRLLLLFAFLMLLVGTVMLRRRKLTGRDGVEPNRDNIPKLLGLGLATGTLSGFFGIGGGFLIVPGLMLATGMPIFNAIGSSLVAVTAFGATAAANYALSGLVDWRLAATFIAGGIAGGLAGTKLARRLAPNRGRLNTIFATVIFAVALYILYRSV